MKDGGRFNLLSILNTNHHFDQDDVFEIQKGANHVDVPFLAFTARESYTENSINLNEPQMPPQYGQLPDTQRKFALQW